MVFHGYTSFLILFGVIDIGLGLRCLSCKGTLEPWLCNITNTCEHDQNACGLKQYTGIGGELRYDTFCTSDTICVGESEIFGKRQSSQTLCGSTCCYSDLCNENCNGSSTSGFTTPSFTTDINTEYLLMYPYMSYSDNIYVLISSTSPGHLDIEVPHIAMNKTISLNNGTNYIKFNHTLMTSLENIVEHKGIYLKSSVPVTVFVITDWRYDTNHVNTSYERSEGFMVLPKEKLGRQYRVIRGESASAYQLFSIASLYDDTEVNLQIESSRGYLAINGRRYYNGDLYTVTLQRLDTLCFVDYYKTGTTIRSDKPIAMIGGSDYTSYAYNPIIEFLPPVSMLGTVFIMPPFPDTPAYHIRLLLAMDGEDAVVDVTNATGTHQYRIKYSDVSTDITVESGPSFITSTRPIYVTVKTYRNSSIPSVLVSIPSISNYKNNYIIPNPNSITPHNFDQYAIIVIPSSKLSGLMISNNKVHSTAVNPTLLVNSTIYTFLTIPTDDPRNVITHKDSSVKFGAFIFGKSLRRQSEGYSRYAFPAGFQ